MFVSEMTVRSKNVLKVLISQYHAFKRLELRADNLTFKVGALNVACTAK